MRTIGYQILNLLELVKLVVGSNVVAVEGDHAREEAAEGSDAVALADTCGL